MSFPGYDRTGAPTPQSVAALVRWLAECGVDTFLSDSPRDRFAETLREATERHGRPASPAKAAAAPVSHARGRDMDPAAADAPAHLPAYQPAVPGEDLAHEARERARSANSLAELQAAYAAFDGCALKLTAKSLVFGNGPERAGLMLIGEAPGREEDIAGEPFVGRSGQLLNRMLGAIGLERQNVRVTNVIAWRPPGNRAPTPAETELCLPFVLRQIELVSPRVVVCLGSPSAKAILATQEGIMRLRGRWSEISLPHLPQPVAATALLHPAYLLRQPSQKRLAWRDLLQIKARLAEGADADRTS